MLAKANDRFLTLHHRFDADELHVPIALHDDCSIAETGPHFLEVLSRAEPHG